MSGSVVRSAEGSAVGLSRTGAEDAKRLALETAHRVSRPPEWKQRLWNEWVRKPFVGRVTGREYK